MSGVSEAMVVVVLFMDRLFTFLNVSELCTSASSILRLVVNWGDLW